MNTEQEIKSIKANLDRLYSELNVVRAMVLKLAQLPDGIIGNTSDSPYVKSDSHDLNHYLPKVGEVVGISHMGDNFRPRIFVRYNNDNNEPFECVRHNDEEEYISGESYDTYSWRYCRRLNGEIIEFGCDAKQPERNEAEQTNPYAVDWTNAPEWADVHCWDENGNGFWYGIIEGRSSWIPNLQLIGRNLPDGLDWKLSKTFRPR